MVQPLLLDPTFFAPPGFSLYEDFLTPAQEKNLAEDIAKLSFQAIESHGVTAKRRAIHFGLRYDYLTKKIGTAEPIPDFLLALRMLIAEKLQIEPALLAECIINEYTPEAAIGWHRDAPVYDRIIGISLLSDCEFKFRPKDAVPEGKRKSTVLHLPARSMYMMTGSAATEWEHSIPPIDRLRYSVTFRTLGI